MTTPLTDGRAVPIPSPGAIVLRRRRVGPVTVTEALHPPRTVLRPHAHATGTITLVLAGEFSERVGGTSPVVVRDGAVFRCAGCPHMDVFEATGVHALHLAGLQAHAPRREWLHAVTARLPVLALALLGELWRDDPSAALARESLVEEIVVEMRGEAARPEGGPSPPPWLVAAVEMLHDRSGDHVTIGDIATEVGVHRVTLAREFRRQFRTTPGHYLRRIRLRRALRAIALEHRPLPQAALRAGFYDQSHLTRWVRRETGTTPGRVSGRT